MERVSRLVPLLLLLLLAGCGTDPAATQPWRTVNDLWHLNDDHLPTAEALKRLPYAAIFAKVDRGPTGMMVLAHARGDELEWVSGDWVWLKTRHGRISGLAHWPEEIVGFRSSEKDPLPRMTQRAEASYHYELDLMPGYRARIPFSAHLYRQKEETVKVGYGKQRLLHVVERVEAPALHFQATNHYWLDPVNGRVMKSVQTPAPGIGPVSLEWVKPYAPR